MSAPDALWLREGHGASEAPDAGDDAALLETQSLYASSAWRTGKREGPPPIFKSIGYRQPYCVEFDAELRAQETMEELLAFARRSIQRFDAGNIVVALSTLPKLSSGGRSFKVLEQHPAWLELRERALACLPRLEPRGLSMVAYALARLQCYDQEMLEVLVDADSKRINEFSATDLAKTAWALAKLCVVNAAWDLWTTLAKEATRKCCSGSFIDISMTAWAFASIGFGDRALFGQLATAAIDQRAELPPQTVANLSWAFAKAKVKNEQLYDALAERAVACAADFDRQGVSNTLWGFATAGSAREDVFSVLAAHTVETGLWRKFSPQMASNLVWAFSRAGITDVPLFEAIAQFIRDNANRLDNLNISNLAWAYSMAELQNRAVFETLTQCARGRLHSFRLTELNGLLWAFARAKVAGSSIFEEATEALLPHTSKLDAQGVSNVIWVFATAGHLRGSPVPGARELIDGLVSALLDMRIRLDSEGAAMTVWALWRANRFHDAWTLYVRTLSDGRHPASGKVWKQNSVDGRQQYWQTLLMETERRGDVLKQVYLWKQMASDSYARSLRAAFLNCAVMALLHRGDVEDAEELLRQLVRTRLGTAVTQLLADRLNSGMEIAPAETIDNALRRRPSQASRYEDFHHKEVGVLEAILAVARPGDPASVCAAVEEISLKETWLKVSGGEKACILDNVLQRHKPKQLLEYGAYVGYTTTRVASQMRDWGGKVVSLEMDPINVAIARNVLEFAGLSNVATVMIGHSDDSVPVVLETLGEHSVDFVFMDQRGTRFHADLQRLERLQLITDPCVVIADNVLNPGAPLHVWRVCSMPHYATDIITLHKFGAPQVRDWVTVSVVRGGASYGQDPEDVPELVALARGADRFRTKAKTMPNREVLGEPSEELADRFTNRFAEMGIRPSLADQRVHCELEEEDQIHSEYWVMTARAHQDGAVSWLVQLPPGEAAPSCEDMEYMRSGELRGGHWRSAICDPQPPGGPRPTSI